MGISYPDDFPDDQGNGALGGAAPYAVPACATPLPTWVEALTTTILGTSNGYLAPWETR